MSKSGVAGKNKHWKSTTAVKKRKKREQTRGDKAWVFSTDDSSKSAGKHHDAWMLEPIGKEQRTTAQVKQELKHVEQERAAISKSR